MEITLLTYIIILPLIFLAGLIDSIAGGGGLVSVPAYLVAGFPVHYALGSNKFSSTFGTLVATFRYFKSGFIDIKVALISSILALIGSTLGTRTVLLVNPNFMNYLLVILIPLITIFMFRKKELGITNNVFGIGLLQKYIYVIIIGLIIGFYDGFFGPGTGSFLVFCFVIFLKYDLLTANGNSKVVNLASNIAALVTFLINGKVIFSIAIPAVLCGIAGNYIGSRFVIKKGVKIIRPIFLFVLVVLFIKILFDIIKGSFLVGI